MIVEYLTTLWCPVCRTVIEEITHPEEKLAGMASAMLGSGGRSLHAEKSPQCVGRPGWERGWDSRTAKLLKLPQLPDVRVQVVVGGPDVDLEVIEDDGQCLKIVRVPSGRETIVPLKDDVREIVLEKGTFNVLYGEAV